MSKENINEEEEASAPSASSGNLGELDDPANCRYCNNHPCVLEEVEPVLEGLMLNYSTIKTNKQLRYTMYTESVRTIHGSCLGKGIRKKVPKCVDKRIKDLAPDKTYTGFKETSNDK